MCCAGLFDAHSALLGVRRGGAWNAGDVETPRATEPERAKSSAFMLAVVVGVVLLIGTGAIRGDGP